MALELSNFKLHQFLGLLRLVSPCRGLPVPGLPILLAPSPPSTPVPSPPSVPAEKLCLSSPGCNAAQRGRHPLELRACPRAAWRHGWVAGGCPQPWCRCHAVWAPTVPGGWWLPSGVRGCHTPGGQQGGAQQAPGLPCTRFVPCCSR